MSIAFKKIQKELQKMIKDYNKCITDNCKKYQYDFKNMDKFNKCKDDNCLDKKIAILKKNSEILPLIINELDNNLKHFNKVKIDVLSLQKKNKKINMNKYNTAVNKKLYSKLKLSDILDPSNIFIKNNKKMLQIIKSTIKEERKEIKSLEKMKKIADKK
jgi:hypothetical protein